MTKSILLIVLMMLTCGFIGLGHKKMNESEKNKQMAEVQKRLEAGEFYKASQLAERIHQEFPQDPETTALLQEVSLRQEERYTQLNTNPVEEMDERERLDALKTSEERAQELFRAGRYAEASDAAQDVFRYDPNSAKASKILDRVGQAARKEAKREEGIMSGVYKDELSGRADAYRQEARRAMDEDQWGRARFAVEKLLILAPNDPEGNRLYAVINNKLEKKAA